MLLLIDNYDSFTYNLAQHFGELGCEVVVKRNDELTIDAIGSLSPNYICISPGPCTPKQAGISKEVILRFGPRIPLLGVCLGHQCIAECFGAKIVYAPEVVHGKPSFITHRGDYLFSGLPMPFEAGRYHSLLVDAGSVPTCLTTTAEAADQEVMGLRHREFPIHGVQFHPESILTPEGQRILANFLSLGAA